MLRRLPLAALLALVLGLAACAPASPPAPSAAGGRTGTSAVDPASLKGLEAQAAWAKGSPADLERIAGDERWLGGAGLEAYRDADGAECVYDRERDAVLSWEPGLRTVASTREAWKPQGYDVSAGAAAAKADPEARKAHKGDVTALRRTVQIDDKGNGPIYVFQYDRYIGGVRVPDHVTVDASGADGTPGFTAFYTKPYESAKGFRPKLKLQEAAAKAASAVGLKEWRFVSAELYLEPTSGKTKPKVVWAIAVSEKNAGATPKLALVDPLTGEASPAE